VGGGAPQGMTPIALGMAFLVGGGVGIVSGLLGIGGGLLMVPFLYLLMGGSSWSGVQVPYEFQAAFAHATSLVVIVPTALAGMLTFRRAGVVEWRTVLPLGGAAALTALLGARVAVALPTDLLKASFGLFLLVMSMRTWRGKRGGEPEGGGPGPGGARAGIRPIPALLGGGAVGFLSALLGVGGGVVAIPILIHWAGLELRRVVPASIAIILFAAPAGVLGYALSGRGIEGLPPGSLGLVYLPAALAMIPGAVGLAPLGAHWNQRIGLGWLRGLLAALLLLIGARLLWQHGAALPGLGS